MNKLFVLAAAAAVAGCQDYESPGAVADESIWSPVPADSHDQGLRDREERQRDVAQLEERVTNLDYRIDRLESASEARAASPNRERSVVELRETLQSVREELRAMRGLYDEGTAFRERDERATRTLDDLERRVQALSDEQAG